MKKLSGVSGAKGLNDRVLMYLWQRSLKTNDDFTSVSKKECNQITIES